MIPWYDLMHRLNFTFIFSIAWMIIFFFLFLSVICFLTLKFKWIPLSDSGENIIGLFASLRVPFYITLLFSLAASFFLNKFRDFFFSPAVFIIGQGESRFKRKEQFQWIVVIGFFVSLAAGLVLMILSGLRA